MTKFVNTLGQFIFIFVLSFSSEKLFADSTESQTENAFRSLDKSEKTVARRIQLVQILPKDLHFHFSNFTTKWFLSEKDFQNFWKQSSMMNAKAPEVSIDWKTEQVLGIFWEGKDDVVRIPAFAGTEVRENDGVRQLRLYFNLNRPCFGIITDVSPAQFLIVDKDLNDIDRIVVATENTKATGCY